MLVDEPLGVTASYQNPRTVFGGSILKNGYGSHPEEVYVCPRGFAGDYTIRVSTIYTNPEKPVTRLTLETITQEGTTGEKKQTFDLNPDKPNKPVVVHLSAGRRKKVLPFVDPEAELMKAAAPAMKSIKTPSGAPGNSPKGGASPDRPSRRPRQRSGHIATVKRPSVIEREPTVRAVCVGSDCQVRRHSVMIASRNRRWRSEHDTLAECGPARAGTSTRKHLLADGATPMNGCRRLRWVAILIAALPGFDPVPLVRSGSDPGGITRGQLPKSCRTGRAGGGGGSPS